MINLFELMTAYGHEQVVFCSNKGSNLRVIIAIHDTTLGPALGGTRMLPYESEEAAIIDALRLSRAMTYKNSVARVNFGGGKGVIIADPLKDKNEVLLRSYGRFVQSLKGRFITAEDIGSTIEDMVTIRKETRWVTGLPSSMGGSGDPSTFTAFSVVKGMQACVKELFGIDSLTDKVVAIQGLGHVGYEVARLLYNEGAKLICCEPINTEAAMKARKQFDATLVTADAIYDVECDIFAPCAIGAILNDETIPRLKCKIVAGSANNQLAVEERDGLALTRLGILYAPDYVINAGGVINCAMEHQPGGYNADAARANTAKIYDTVSQVVKIAKSESIPTYKAADRLAEAKIEKTKGGYKL